MGDFQLKMLSISEMVQDRLMVAM